MQSRTKTVLSSVIETMFGICREQTVSKALRGNPQNNFGFQDAGSKYTFKLYCLHVLDLRHVSFRY